GGEADGEAGGVNGGEADGEAGGVNGGEVDGQIITTRVDSLFVPSGFTASWYIVTATEEPDI
nr:hypothetical protein [Chlorobiota bacterium]